MADGAPQLFDDAPRNVEHQNQIKAGDPRAAFKRPARVTQRMISQRLCGVPSRRAGPGRSRPATGGLVVWATHQAPHNLATIWDGPGPPQNMVRVIAPRSGRLRVKFGIYAEERRWPRCAPLPHPLRWIETRVEQCWRHARARAGH